MSEIAIRNFNGCFSVFFFSKNFRQSFKFLIVSFYINILHALFYQQVYRSLRFFVINRKNLKNSKYF